MCEHFRHFQLRPPKPNYTHVWLGTSSACWCQKTAEDNLPEKLISVPPRASKHSIKGVRAPQRTELRPWSSGWMVPSISSFPGPPSPGFSKCLGPIKGGNATVRCQQLHPLQNKKPLSGINVLSNYSPLERKSAFSQGDSRTLGLCMLSFPFHG